MPLIEVANDNYIDKIATAIGAIAEPEHFLTSTDMPLYRIYAVLALVKGRGVTAENVHDAWAAWQATGFPEHRSLLPFDQLSEEVQRLDDDYVTAIRWVAERLANHAAD